MDLALAITMLLVHASAVPAALDTASLKNIANISYAPEHAKSSHATIFSPRMDFEQWKPLTGRGDPLRNDPTYDYEPPVLERVHYWADDTRVEREHYPEKKSEVLMLGVSSRKPSAGPRPPPPPPPPPPSRRHHRPHLPKYEDFTYKLSDHYHMTILVPPPPPPPGHKLPIFTLEDDKRPSPSSHIKITDPPKPVPDATTSSPEYITSLYALQEANLIYQSSTTSHNWLTDINQTKTMPNAVSSDYMGWGPTTLKYENYDLSNDKNEAHNFISHDHTEHSPPPYSFYKPMLSEAPPPPENPINHLLLPTFVPTALPPTEALATVNFTHTYMTPPTTTSERVTTEYPTTETRYTDTETTTDNYDFNIFTSTPVPSTIPENNIFDMLSPMMSMPLVNGPERPEDNLYAYASENLQVYKEHTTEQTEDSEKLETMQTMQPPPPNKQTESTTVLHKRPIHVNSHNKFQHKKPSLHTHDPYLHMRYTTPLPTIASSVDAFDNSETTTAEAPAVPMYLIIQGHSKVKTYGSQPKSKDDIDTIINEITRPNESSEVKHLHPVKEKFVQKHEQGEVTRRGKVQNLKSLLDAGHGSIEIQETDLGIKYDVSDGGDVPIEIYRKGIVDNEENNYVKKVAKENRSKRQIDLEDILPFDGDNLEEYVYNFLKVRQNETGITGLIAQAVTGKAGAILDGLDDDDDDDDDESEER